MKIIGFGKCSLDKIIKFENKIGFYLPKDYKEFILNQNGGYPEKKYATFKVEELNQEISIDTLYGFELEKQLNLEEYYNEYKEELLEDTIIIGDDMGGGMIVLVNQKCIKGIYYWANSHYFELSNKESNSYKIADSFKEFIDNLKEYEE